MAEEKQTPDQRDAAQERQQEAVSIVRAVYEGTLRLRKEGRKYLPQMSREEDKDYAARLAVARLFNAYRRTIGGLVGLVMAKDPQLADNLPPQIAEHAENIDMAGRHLAVFARDHFTNALIDGHAAIMVDMPAVEPGDVQTLADERELLGRPYWVEIQKSQILRVRTLSIAGRLVLSRFAYRETVHEDDGEFGQKEVQRVRDYALQPTRDGWRPLYRVWSKRKDASGKEEWTEEQIANPVMSIARIPVATTYTHRTGYMESEPPLFDLAEENLNHYQTRSDRTNVLRIGSVPVLALIGVSSDDVTIGPNNALVLPAGGDAKFVEVAGPALQESREELREIERRMAVLGLSLLMGDQTERTATETRIDKGDGDSQLSSAARGLQDALEDALGIHAEWLNLELPTKNDKERWVTINREFENLPIDAQMVMALSNVVAAGQLPLEDMYAAFKRGKILPDGFDPEKAREMLEGAGMAPPTLDIAA